MKKKKIIENQKKKYRIGRKEITTGRTTDGVRKIKSDRPTDVQGAQNQ